MIALQIRIYVRKFLRIQKLDYLKNIMFGAVIALFVVAVIKDSMFSWYFSTKSGLFAIVSACIWIGIFNSIQLICREKNDIVKDELDKGLHASAYIAAHFICQALLCLVQSIIITAICCSKIDFPSDGIIVSAYIEYFISIFLITYSADALALIISSITSKPVTAMTVMPFILIIQLLMPGVLISLPDSVSPFSSAIISKWGIESVGSISDLNTLRLEEEIDNAEKAARTYSSRLDPEVFGEQAEEEFVPDEEYDYSTGHLCRTWLTLAVFSAVSYLICVIALKRTTRTVKR